MSKDDRFRAFMNLSKETNVAYRNAAHKYGLSDSAFDILYFLETEGPLTQKELRLPTYSSKQTVNSSVQKMIKLGFIYIDEARGREKVLRLTEKGLTFAQATTQKVYEAERRAFESLGARDQEKLLALSAQFTHALVQEIDALEPLTRAINSSHVND